MLSILVLLSTATVILAQGCGGRNATLCGDGENCCNNNYSTCCDDELDGSVCCIDDYSTCCPRTGKLASRCCARWHVCCPEYLNIFGCCDPAAVKKHNEEHNEKVNARAAVRIVSARKGAASRVVGLMTNFPLLTPGGFLNVVQFDDLTTGTYSFKEAPSFYCKGVNPRPFTFVRAMNSFVLLHYEVNGSPPLINMYAVDIATGAVTVAPIHVAGRPIVNDVLSFKHVPETNTIIFSTPIGNSTDRSGEATFYGIDARAITAFRRAAVDATPEQPFTAPAVIAVPLAYTLPEHRFDGYFTTVSYDHAASLYHLLRVGYFDASTGDGGFGVAVIDIPVAFPQTPSVARVSWAALSYPAGVEVIYRGDAVAVKAGATSVMSLVADATGALSVAVWSLNYARMAATKPLVVASLGQSFQPIVFSQLVTAAAERDDGTLVFATIVRSPGRLSPITDTLSFATVMVSPSGAVTTNLNSLSPMTSAATNLGTALAIID